ncbi:hypothetical protein [Lederbergia citrea]|uniref:Uncharacterized protein n=1 Tax=Lederbergia citrea TaxID=2833581 RepID=A0A942UU74_9BACI|nr:hypothetical protein [Lederbergia citrea]MBS4224014.1 hypothetical protein [Lederbergia citrea]
MSSRRELEHTVSGFQSLKKRIDYLLKQAENHNVDFYDHLKRQPQSKPHYIVNTLIGAEGTKTPAGDAR